MYWRSRNPGIAGGHFRRWLHIDEDTIGPSNEQLHLISGEFFCGTDLLRRSASERRQEDEEAMEGLKTLQPDTSSPAFEIQATQKNPARSSSSRKLLQLTPLWEHIIRNQQIPPEIDKEVLFAELAARLCDLEWEVRGHALRVLVDLIPVMELSELDRYMMPVLLRELTYNLGHSAPSVRKGALDTLGVYLNHSTDPETVLRNIVAEGLEKQTLTSPAKGNVAMGVILSIPSLVSPLLTPTNGIVLISQTGLIHLVSSLSKKLVQDTYQKQSLKTLVRIREMVGEARFDRFLEGFHPQCKKDFDILCQVYDVRMNLGDSGIDLHVPLPGEDLLFEGNGSNSGHGYWYDGSTPAAYPTAVSPEDAVFRDLNQNVVLLDDKSSSSENMADSPLSLKDDGAGGMGSINHLTGTVTENYGRDNVHGRGEVMENGHRNYREVYSEQTSGIKRVSSDRSYTEDREENLEVAIEERSAPLSESKDCEEKSVTVVEGEPLKEGTLNFSRVVLETEFKLNGDAAIMMTILEEGNTSPQEKLCSDETGTVSHGEEDRETGADDEGYRMYNNNFIMKVLTDDEDYNDDDDVAVPDEPIRRTPRRVRFGGEVVMMRTPDSEETAVLQQNGDSLSQDDVNEGCSDSENGAVEESTGDGAIEAVIPDARRDSTVCSKDNSSHESVSYARSSSRGQSAAQEKLDNAKQNMPEKGSRRDSITFTRQGTLTEIKQNSEDGARQDSCERSRRGSVHEAKQDSVENLPSGPNGDEITKTSVEGSLDDTRCSPNEACKRDSTEDTKEGSAEERVRGVTAADDVGQKDEEMPSSLQSHIPVPVIPARSKPRDHKRRGSLRRKRQSMRESETSTDTQQQSSDLAEGTRMKQGSGESVNGAENDGRESTLWAPEESDWRGAEHEYNDQNWEELGIVTKSVLDDLHDQVR